MVIPEPKLSVGGVLHVAGPVLCLGIWENHSGNVASLHTQWGFQRDEGKLGLSAILPVVGSRAEDLSSTFPWPPPGNGTWVFYCLTLGNFFPSLGFNFLIYKTKWLLLDDL